MKWVVLGNRAIFTVRMLIMKSIVAGDIFEKRAFGAIEAHRGIRHGGYFTGGTGFAVRGRWENLGGELVEASCGAGGTRWFPDVTVVETFRTCMTRSSGWFVGVPTTWADLTGIGVGGVFEQASSARRTNAIVFCGSGTSKCNASV